MLRVAMLSGSEGYSVWLETHVELHPEAGVEIVWIAQDPSEVLAALDHSPDLFLLDMAWGEEALAAGRILHQAGLPRVLCLFAGPDPELAEQASQLGFGALPKETPWAALLACLKGQAAG